MLGVAGDDAHPGGLDVELLGGDLHERGEHALAELDLAGRKPHGAIRLEADPAIEPRIVGEVGRQRGHADPPRRRSSLPLHEGQRACPGPDPGSIVAAGEDRVRGL